MRINKYASCLDCVWYDDNNCMVFPDPAPLPSYHHRFGGINFAKVCDHHYIGHAFKKVNLAYAVKRTGKKFASYRKFMKQDKKSLRGKKKKRS